MNQELKIKVTSNAEQASKSFKELEKALKGTKTELTGMTRNSKTDTFRTLTKDGNRLLRTVQTLNKDGSLKSFSQTISNAGKESNKTAAAFSKLAKMANIVAIGGAAITGIRSLGRTLQKGTAYAIDYSEALNLFNVVFGNIYKNGTTTFTELGRKADNFQKKLAYNFGVNTTEAMTYQGLFQSMGESMGIDKASAYTMSENSTKLVYDLSSLFNKEQEDTAEALRAGIYAGQTKPLRTYGIDITETSLQETLNSMAEMDSRLQNLSVSTMSQAEKQLLRYMTVLRQTTNAQGDFANTLESPANLLKTLQNQLINMSVALGNLFVKPFQKILQYANAIIMVITRVAQSIASLFGIDMDDYNTGGAGVAGLGEYEDSMDGVGNSADNAAKKAKALNRQLLKFDEVNNLTTPSSAGSSGGAGGGGGASLADGINQALIDNLRGYENGLDNVKLKAQEIADTIMKWLGFTYDAETETWKLGSAYDNIKASIKNFADAFKVFKDFSFDALSSFYENLLKPLGKWTLGEGLPRFFDISANLITSIDWDKINAHLTNFWKALEPFAENVGQGILWLYENALSPLANFTFSNVLPTFLSTITNLLNILNKTIEAVSPVLKNFYDYGLKPLAAFAGNTILNFFKSFNSVLEIISKSKAASTITAITAAIIALKGPSNFISLLAKPFKNLGTTIAEASTKSGAYVDTLQAMILAAGTGEKKTLSLKTSIDNVKTSFKNAGTAIGDMGNKLKNGIINWTNTASAIDKVAIGLAGIGVNVASVKTFTSSLTDMVDNGASATNVMGSLGGALGTVGGAMATGASVGGLWGAAIGGVVAGIELLIGASSALDTSTRLSKQYTEELTSSYDNFKKSMDELRASHEETINSLQNNFQVQIGQISYAENMVEKLGDLIGANGKIDKSNRELADTLVNQVNKAYGSNLTIVDGVIKNDGKVIKTKQDLITWSKKYAEQLKKEALIELQTQAYKAALEEQAKAKKNLEKTEREYIETLNNSLKSYKEGKLTAQQLDEKLKEADDRRNESLKDYNDQVATTQAEIKKLDDMTNIYATGTASAMEKLFNQTATTSGKIALDTKTQWNLVTDDIKGALEKSGYYAQQSAQVMTNAYNGFYLTTNGTFAKLPPNIQPYFDATGRNWSTTLNSMNTTTKTKVDQINKNLGNIDTDTKTCKVNIKTTPSNGYKMSFVDDPVNKVSKVVITPYANGGFPEEGPFFMNQGEIAGKFSNGRSVVANNEQITEGIKRAVLQGMNTALSKNGGQQVNLNITTEEGILVRKVVNGINEITAKTGSSPLAI